MLNLFAGCLIGFVFGFVVCAVLSASKRSDDCLNCAGLIQREEDVRALTKSRDILRNRCDQLELQVHALRSKNGKLSQEVQRTSFLKQKEA